MNDRLTALSMSSTHMKMMIALRRVSTPTTPITNSTAEKKSASGSIGIPPLADHHRADDRGEQQHTRHLERQQVLVEERAGHRRDRAARRDLLGGVSRGQRELHRGPGANHGADLGDERHT